MIRTTIQCAACHASEVWGTRTPPVDARWTGSARVMRLQCKQQHLCAFEAIAEEFEPNEVDRLRLGMREDRVIA